MTHRLKNNGGDFAIYDTAAGDAPLTAPLSNIPLLAFHSALDYPYVLTKYTGTLALGAVGTNTLSLVTHTIVAHGRPGTPYIEGKIFLGGKWVALAGSVPVAQLTATLNHFGFVRMIHLGANATNILIREYSLSYGTQGYGAQNISYEIYLTDVLV